MGKKQRVDNGFVLFDVYYEDGGRSSNRRVPSGGLGGLDGDEPALTHIMGEERRIADLSGKPPRQIKRVVRSA